MPANLTPQYYEAEKKYREAKTPQEKLAYLQEMLAIMPKHKGTEKIQGDLKSKISKIKEALEHGRKSGGGPSAAWYQVDKQGAGQVAMLGLPNAGKSALLNALTNANVPVAEYPYTTTSPQVGMMPYEDILIQIIDTPPLSDDTQPWMYSIFRSADLALIVLDATEDLETQYELIQEMLAGRNIACDLGGNAAAAGGNVVKAVLCVNKTDAKEVEGNLKDLNRSKKYAVPFIPVSAQNHDSLTPLKQEIFKRLGIIRVYTKKAGQAPARKDPVVLKSGTTVIDAAEHIHKDFKQNLQYTRLWNDAGYTGQRVEKNYVLHDGDIIEFHV
jgi:ribosome-interacting GTPase 1